jgi:uncharacterized protein (TIGR00375 family)
MEFVADLHIHSYLSRATAKNLNLEYLNAWAQLKGITVLATGDFTHPQWFSEICEKLEPKEEGLFGLKPAFAAETAPLVPPTCQGPVRFTLCVEISSIYKKDGKTRKVHNLVFVPTLEAAERFAQRLKRIGNIASDGRPILGLDSRTLLEIVLETSENAFLIPAHIWTPWFSVLGSKSGFDSIEECFEDLTGHIFALETGLSADPAMNWRLSSLDRFTLVSNSDAHSPANLGREANLFDTELSYLAIRDALKTGDPKHFLGTLEYFAEEGKYHFDGHRKCNQRLSPLETLRNKGLCPVCGKPVTVGVMYRVQELADRAPGAKPKGAHPYTSLLPLADVLSEVLQVGPKSKKVTTAYATLVERLGPEFQILQKTSIDTLERHGPPLLSEAIRRMRDNEFTIAPGYDGEFGTVSLFTEDERHHLLGQKRLPDAAAARRPQDAQPFLFDQTREALIEEALLVAATRASFVEPQQRRRPARPGTKKGLLKELNAAQQEAAQHRGGPLLIVAGPGTGKTRTLTHRIAYLLQEEIARPGQVLAVTFTNKAAQEMAERLESIVQQKEARDKITMKTFHALCLHILSQEKEALGRKHRVCVLNEGDRRDFIKMAMEHQRKDVSVSAGGPKQILHRVSLAKQLLLSPEHDLSGLVPQTLLSPFRAVYETYQHLLLSRRVFDFDDLIFQTVQLFETNHDLLRLYRQRFSFISVDEYQDINYAQYRLIRLLAPPNHDICVIGDPHQAIYGFRGADVQYFNRFCTDYPGARTIHLNQNYRSTETILRASGQVMGTSDGQKHGSGVWSGIYGEKALTVSRLPTERAEAEHIVKTIEQEMGGISHFSVDSGRIDPASQTKERSFSDFAVLYRVKEQAKALGEAFERSGVPFQLVGDKKLETRRGIKELVSYLKVGLCVGTDLDLQRIINFPLRAIGRHTVETLNSEDEETRNPVETALDRAARADLTPRARRALTVFTQDLKVMQAQIQGLPVYKQLQWILQHFAIRDKMCGHQGLEEDLEALFAMARSSGNDSMGFLVRLALESDQDRYDPVAERVALMTMHASKGLEFPVLFIAGCEDGLIPFRKQDDAGDLLEEKRLFYVALTRAREKIFLTHVNRRLWLGKQKKQRISPYVEAIQEDLKLCRSPFSGRPAQKKRVRQLSLFQ